MTSPPTFLTVDAIEAWRPDAVCLAAGDEHAHLALRCFAGAGLSDAAIAQRLWQPFGATPECCDDAAIALARHGALVGASAHEIVKWIAGLALVVPCWPDDPEQIAMMSAAALREAGR